MTKTQFWIILGLLISNFVATVALCAANQWLLVKLAKKILGI